jgi:hypothetical protein
LTSTLIQSNEQNTKWIFLKLGEMWESTITISAISRSSSDETKRIETLLQIPQLLRSINKRILKELYADIYI